MKMTIESTDAFTILDGVLCRIWHGTTDGVVSCELAIPSIRVREENNQTEFEEELKELKPLTEGVFVDWVWIGA